MADNGKAPETGGTGFYMPGWLAVAVSFVVAYIGVVIAAAGLAVYLASYLGLEPTGSIHEVTVAPASDARLPPTATKTTTKDTTTKNVPSDALLLGIEALGVAMILAGVLYPRLTKLTIGGQSLETTPVTTKRLLPEAANAVSGVDATKPSAQRLDPAKKAVAAHIAAANAADLVREAKSGKRPKRPGTNQPLSPDEIQHLVTQSRPSQALWAEIAADATQQLL